jgi:hypothetical protein
VSVVILAASVPLSYLGGIELGLAGAAIGSACALYLDRVLVLRRIAAVTGVPVRAQQHWRSLARHLGWTAIATLGAWLVAHHLFAGSPIIVRLAMGAAVLAAVYAPVNWKHLRTA